MTLVCVFQLDVAGRDKDRVLLVITMSFFYALCFCAYTIGAFSQVKSRLNSQGLEKKGILSIVSSIYISFALMSCAIVDVLSTPSSDLTHN